MAYDSINLAAKALVPQQPGRVLELGCGSGSFGAWMSEALGHHVVGITHDPIEAEQARWNLEAVRVLDLDLEAIPMETSFDGLVALHVLEHLKSPEKVLQAVGAHLQSGAWILIAVPNGLHWRQRWAFLRGRFQYTEGGLMDRTHLRFFDWESAADLLKGQGWDLEVRKGDGGFPGSRFLGTWLGKALDRLVLRFWPGLFSWQFLILARVPREVQE